MHKDSQRRIIEKDGIYFITTNTFDSCPYFMNEVLCWLFIAQLRLVKLLKGFDLYAFCVLYDHVHLLLKPSDKFDLSKIMQYLKRNFSRHANFVMGYSDYDIKRHTIVPNEGDNNYCRLPHGEDEKILLIKMNKYLLLLKTKYSKIPRSERNQYPPFRWQKSYHDHLIRNEKDFEQHYEYTVQNFKKEPKLEYEYPEEYKFTSFNFSKYVDQLYI